MRCFCFNRRVPLDVARHSKSRLINFSLQTKLVRELRQSLTAMMAQLGGYWQHLRLCDASVPGAQLLYVPNDELAGSWALRFSEATDWYLRLKGQGKAETFYRAAAHACRCLTEVTGDKPSSRYVRTYAAQLLENLVKKRACRQFSGTSIYDCEVTLQRRLRGDRPWIKDTFVGVYLDQEQGVLAGKPIPAHVIFTKPDCHPHHIDDDAKVGESVWIDKVAGGKMALAVFPPNGFYLFALFAGYRTAGVKTTATRHI